jgi:hypothetical protein
MRIRAITTSIVLLVGAAAQAGEARDPKAIAALERMGAFLRSQTVMKIMAETATDDVIGGNQKVQLVGAVELMVRRPDRLRANVATDRKIEQIYYDGNAFTVYQPRLNYFASFSAPPTLAGLMDVAEQRYGLDMPLADLFAWGTARSRPADILGATNLGTSMIKGVPCDHYAFHQADVDWQVWIQQGEQPLPRKLIITTITERSQPQHQAVLTWDLAPKLADGMFTFIAPKGAQRIEFETVVEQAAPFRQGRSTPKPRGTP